MENSTASARGCVERPTRNALRSGRVRDHGSSTRGSASSSLTLAGSAFRELVGSAGRSLVWRTPSRRARYCLRYSQASMPRAASESSSARSSEAWSSARSSGLSSSSITTTSSSAPYGQVGGFVERDATFVDADLARMHGFEDTAFRACAQWRLAT